MIRIVLTILALSLLPVDALAGKKPKFKPVPGAEATDKIGAPKRREGQRFKSAPSTGAEVAVIPPAEWLPPRPVAGALPAEWVDALGRCLQSVASMQPMNVAGLVNVGDRVVDYQKPYTRQSWLTPSRAVSMNYEIEAGFGNTPSRLCKVGSVKGRGTSAGSAQAIDDGFVLWAYDLIGMGQYTDERHPESAGLRPGDTRYALVSKSGNARRCLVRIRFEKTFFGDKAEVSISVAEVAKKPCSRKPGNIGGA